jgi:hypothetical protein
MQVQVQGDRPARQSPPTKFPSFQKSLDGISRFAAKGAPAMCNRAREMKKRINPSITARVRRSTLILVSVLAIHAIPLARAQSRNRLPANESNSPERNIISDALLQPGVATHEIRTGLEGVIEFPNATELAARIETGSPASPTEASAGLIIDATFDSSITDDPNSAVIQAMINRAIAMYESLFSDPITVHILFRYSTTAPNGDDLPPNVIAQSFSTIYTLPWNHFVNALRADATTGHDNEAITSLPASPLSMNIAPSSANGRAVELNTQPALFADGHFGPGGPFDGIVTLNSALPFSFTRPLIIGSFDAQRSVEHEIDEVMGLGSHVRPVSCIASAEAESGTLTGDAVVQDCPNCSGGADVGYVGNNSGTLAFSGLSASATGSNVVTIWYLNGDAVRYALLSVNGSPGTPVSFPSTGSFQTVGSVQVTVNLNAGNDNTLTFFNPIVGNWAPDFDWLGVNCSSAPPPNLRPQDLFSWSSPGVRNLTSDGSRYFSIDSGRTSIVGFNQTPPGDLGDWLSEPCPQQHPYVQNAFACPNQFSDISATSPEGINLDVIGYDLVNASTPNTRECSLLQQRLDRLRRRKRRLRRLHRSNPRLNQRIHRVRLQLQNCQ